MSFGRAPPGRNIAPFEIERLIDPASSGQARSQIIVRSDVPRLRPKRALIGPNRRSEITLGQEAIAQVVLRFGSVGFDVQCFLAIANRIVELSLLQKNGAEIGVSDPRLRVSITVGVNSR